MNTANETFNQILKEIPNKYTTIITSLPISNRFFALLSLLGKDGVLLKMIKEDIGKIEHIERLIERLRAYIKVGEVEKKQFGEVFTPFELVNEMLDTLPAEVWTNPNLKWLDPANGCGNYPAVVIQRLMKGLSEWETNEEKRFKHIIENMIYVCELQPKNMFLWMCAIDPKNEYKLNMFRGSFLVEEFDKHMKEEWKLDGFDIVVGNPPYQETLNDRSKGGGKGGDNNLWSKFILKAIIIAKNILFVNPPSFLSPNHNVRNNIFENSFNIKCITFGDFFPGVGTQGCYYLLTKNNIDKTIVNKLFFVKITNEDILPNSNDGLCFNIFDKIFNNNIDKISFRRTCSLHTSNKKQFISKTKNDEFKYDLLSGSKTVYSSIKSEFHDTKKVVVSRSGYLNPSYDNGKKSLSETNFFFEVKTEEEGNNLVSLLNTKLYKFIVEKSKFSGFTNPTILKSLPLLDLSNKWTDEQLSKYFNLTEEEKKLINPEYIKEIEYKFDFILSQIDRENTYENLDKGLTYQTFKNIKEWGLNFGYKFEIYPNDHLINGEKHFHFYKNEENVHLKIDFNGNILEKIGKNNLSNKVEKSLNYFLSKNDNIVILNNMWEELNKK